MQNEREKVLRVLITNLPAIIAIALMSIALNIVNDYNVILSFIVLSIAYVVLGIIVEVVLERMSISPVAKQQTRQAPVTDKPKIVDMTESEPKKQPVKRISTAPYAGQAAERLRKTKINFDDLLEVSNNKDNQNKKETSENDSKVTIINDYSSLLKKVKPKEKDNTDSKTVYVEKISEDKKVKETPKNNHKLNEDTQEEGESNTESLLTESSESFDDFSVKTSKDIEAESNKIKNEIDKRLAGSGSTSLPYRKKKISMPPESFTFDNKLSSDQEDSETEPESDSVNDNDIPEDFVIKNEETDELKDIDDIAFEAPENNEDDNDKVVADSDLINQLYNSPEPKKKQPFWKRFFR